MEARDDVVRYRLQRAREALEDARVLANASRWSACVNRLYYACFYAVSALLLQDETNESSERFEMDLASGKVRALTPLGPGRELPVDSAKR